MNVWRCYFRTPKGRILREPEAFSTEVEATLWVAQIANDPDAFDLYDKSGQSVRASQFFDADGELIEGASVRLRQERVLRGPRLRDGIERPKVAWQSRRAHLPVRQQ